MEKNPEVSRDQEVESNDPSQSTGQVLDIDPDATAIPEPLVSNKLLQWANKLVQSTGAEARGIERVDEALRTSKVGLSQYFAMASSWFSINLTVSGRGHLTFHPRWSHSCRQTF